MAYYWEDTANIDNLPDDPNQYDEFYVICGNRETLKL